MGSYARVLGHAKGGRSHSVSSWCRGILSQREQRRRQVTCSRTSPPILPEHRILSHASAHKWSLLVIGQALSNMAYPPQAAAPPPYFARSGELSIQISRQHGVPGLPVELKGGLIDEHEWHSRMSGLLGIFRRYDWSIGERVWLGIILVMTLIVPWPLMGLARRSILAEDIERNRGLPLDQRSFDPEHFAKAQAVGSLIFLGLFIVGWVPYGLFKLRFRRRLNRYFVTINNAEAAKGHGRSTYWHLAGTSTWQGAALLMIRLPMSYNMTPFHPQAYPPPWLASGPATGPTPSYVAPPASPPLEKVPL
ncbi:uncharacterized protein L969DRAFT_93431 [Mixia osmundae IAM 14324]|uniref:uncharacterized protein n=1 Tax=Mixia osmundae (strain CBS 9802 / IAM 14324 / JCM 22182 / KY 12970) TaxID=764103 RepID=UPI0004A54E60|nr:uncharacterized protein L969DRAFT_93431 [Mixia osmundae IAM 14324]KEI40912.1 hypothetical protein L969DRAFT_93431 [Mixia osmundae IAM 14324]